MLNFSGGIFNTTNSTIASLEVQLNSLIKFGILIMILRKIKFFA